MTNTAVVRVATAGSVDDGKSTLIGRLLLDSKSLLTDQLAHVEEASRRRGFARTELALLTDGLRAEREQGITIDVAWRYFATDKRRFILADTPGHVQYTRNMVTGASTADVAVVLLDAERGTTDQTRRHLLITALVRVPRVIVAVNKMDRVGWSAERFTELAVFAREIYESGGGIGDVVAVPISALKGDNVVDRSTDSPFYEGPTLLSLLEDGAPACTTDGPGRLPIQWVIRPQTEQFHNYRGLAGRVAEGSLQVGERIRVLPAGTQSEIVRIEISGEDRDVAYRGDSVIVHLRDDVDAARGDLIASAAAAPTPVDRLKVDVCWLSPKALQPGARVGVKHTTRRVRGVVEQIGYRRDVTTGEQGPSSELGLNDLGGLHLQLSEPLCVEPYARSRTLGSLILVDEASGETLGAAMAI